MLIGRPLRVLLTGALVTAILLLGTVGRTHAYVHANEESAGECGECRWVKSAAPVVPAAVAAPGPVWTIAIAVIAAPELLRSDDRRGPVESRGPPSSRVY